MINNLKGLYDFVISVKTQKEYNKDKIFKDYIDPVYSHTKHIVNELTIFFQSELDKLQIENIDYMDVLRDIESTRCKDRALRIEIREAIKYSSCFMDNVELKIFAIGVMGVLHGGIFVKEIEYHDINHKYSHIDYDVLFSIVTEKTKLEDLYFKDKHTLMDVINFDFYESHEIDNQKIKQGIIYKRDDVTQKYYENKAFDGREYLISKLNDQIIKIYESWEVVAAAYMVLKEMYKRI